MLLKPRPVGGLLTRDSIFGKAGMVDTCTRGIDTGFAALGYVKVAAANSLMAGLLFMTALRLGGSATGVLITDGSHGLGGDRPMLEYRRGRVCRVDRAAQLIDDTLDPEGLVEVVIEREGLRETWRRAFQDRDTITVTTTMIRPSYRSKTLEVQSARIPAKGSVDHNEQSPSGL
jgi:hypothetical protein